VRFGALKCGGKCDGKNGGKCGGKVRLKLHPKTGVGAMGFCGKNEEKMRVVWGGIGGDFGTQAM